MTGVMLLGISACAPSADEQKAMHACAQGLLIIEKINIQKSDMVAFDEELHKICHTLEHYLHTKGK